ncbi:MAG: ECF transporter S component [Eubacterium sp.]
MKKGANLIYLLFTAAALVFIILWQLFFKAGTSFYLVCVIVIVLSLLPFFISYENSKPSAREVSLVAVLSALAVASRAVFYFVPQFKPIGAVVIVSAVCLGPQRGYIIGSLSAFVSNFIFGQGVWTPFQMVALGLVGFAAGVIFKKVKPNRWLLAAIGFVLAFALYGVVVDASSVLTMLTDYTLSGVLAIYAAGVPFSAVFGGATALFLFVFGEAFIKKINRIIVKYGILEESQNEQSIAQN